MISTNIPFSEVGNLSKIMNDYLNNSFEISDFIFDSPTIEGLQNKIDSRQMDVEKRTVLVTSLKKQYENAGLKAPSSIDLLLKSTTFTVTTGHQLCLFGGPKYFIYKIVSAIKLARHLSAINPSLNVLPVFWMASEDHDFEEINQVTLFKKTFTTSQIAEGPVGRLKPSVFDEVYHQLNELFTNDERAKELLHHFETSFKQKDWSTATRYWVHQLFGDELIILDGDDTALKSLFAPIIEDELIHQKSIVEIENTNEQLKKIGYHTQVTPRAINLFYIETGKRELIVSEMDGNFLVKNIDLKFSKDELLNLLKNHPEKFSPNVVLRPLYQECILPNIAYIGGPGELAYWFQLKSNFDRLNVSFPIIMLRDSFLIIQQKDLSLLQEMKLELNDLFLSENDLIKKYLQLNLTEQIELSKEKEQLNQWQHELSSKLSAIDKDFDKMLGAEFANWNKLFDKIDQKIHKSSKNREEVSINRILKIRNTYFPNDVLNERIDSFIPEWSKNPQYINTLLEQSDVLHKRLKVLVI